MPRFALLLLCMVAACATPPQEPALVPLPVSAEWNGGSFTWTGQLTASGPETDVLAQRIRAEQVETGGHVQTRLTVGMEAEAYRLEIGPEGVQIHASDAAGHFYGLQTLGQIREQSPESALPQGVVEDAPRFAYRGLQLDVGRHFFDVAFVKKYLDLMARYKLNSFHWHLTEDQGWRLEIDQYPRLTEVGSCRAETIKEKNFNPFVGDGTPHCGYYTKDDVREVLAYAAERHIQVIPEIEMPGHARAALAAYPEYGCTGGPYEVSTVWGIHDDVFCPSEATFTFLENILTEVLELFPSEYIHIGADEVPKRQWEAHEETQQIMAREGLADEAELQSWFIRRIERFLNANGRTLVGWDEILEGGLAPNAVVMSWRGTEGGIAAARQGHDVIMTPTRHLYLDFYQGAKESEPISADWSGYPLPLEQVYEFDPIPSELTPEEGRHVLGAQGNVWTEYMKTPDKVEYMVLPRALALAEMVWTPQASRDFGDFERRLETELTHLGQAGYTYRPLAGPTAEQASLN
ncbi:MAG: family 20 glycosylhydrolase [Rhodothermales bacterium]|nr:family 20 glycosylhydrolase [Rhodothermales bacterium]